MKFRVYGYVKDSKTYKAMTGISIKLYLEEEELQKGKSAGNGFYELIAEIDDYRIESGQQLVVTFEKEGFEKQEHRLLATEGSFNLDVKLETATLPPPTPSPFNWLPAIIAGGAVILLLIIGIVVFLLLKPKSPQIISFTADPNSIEPGQYATLMWKIKNAKSVEIEIDQNIVSLDPEGNIQVQPTQTQKYQLIAKGKKGEEITKSQIVVVKDVIPPAVTITHRPSAPNTEERIEFTATGTDQTGIVKIAILVNGTKVEECTGSPCKYLGGPYPPDNISYEAHAWDKSGNKGVAGPKDFRTKDIGSPKVDISSNPTTPYVEDKVTFTVSASDMGGITKVQIIINGTKVVECTGSPCTYIGGPYPLGSVSYEAQAWDKSGNKGVAGPNTLKIGDIRAPVVHIYANPQLAYHSSTAHLIARASDPGGISKVEIYHMNRKEKECSDSPCTYVFTPFFLGGNTYYAKAYDKSGNVSSTPVQIFQVVTRPR